MQNIEEICKKYYSLVYKYLFCLTHNEEISKDLTQETFYKVVKKIDTYKGESKLSVWICEIAKNLWYDELRRNKRRVKQEKVEEISSEENLESNYINKEEIEEFYKRIDNLDEVTKKIIFLRIDGELSFKEIGEVFGKTETWARVTFYRGKQKLKEEEKDG